MSIQWYPGHMHKAVKEMTKAMAEIDVVIELLDARLPYSSHNPSITRLRGTRPSIKVFSKADLADPDATAQWQSWFEQQDAVATLATTLAQHDKAARVRQLCRRLAGAGRIRVMITGIPNVGKSTLINALAGRKIAHTGDEPAITKGMQQIKLDDDIVLFDTPGILWPKIHNANSAYRLAIAGSIKDTATDIVDVAFHLCSYLMTRHPAVLEERFDLASLAETETEVLEQLGARRGCLRKGGSVDLEKVSAILVNEFRAGKLGRLTLETPDMVAAEEAEVEAARVEKAERDKLRKKKWRASK